MTNITQENVTRQKVETFSINFISVLVEEFSPQIFFIINFVSVSCFALYIGRNMMILGNPEDPSRLRKKLSPQNFFIINFVKVSCFALYIGRNMIILGNPENVF